MASQSVIGGCDLVICCLQLVQTRLVDAHVFLTLEMDGNLDAYHERRRTVLEVVTSTTLNDMMFSWCVLCVFSDWSISSYSYGSRAEERGQRSTWKGVWSLSLSHQNRQ